MRPPEWAKVEDFVRKIEKIFFSQIISESSKTYRKPLLKYFWMFFLKKNIHLGHRKISKFSRFSLDIATLVHHCSQSSNTITKWPGTVVHLHVEKLQLLYNRLCLLPCDFRRGSALQPLRFCDWYIYLYTDSKVTHFATLRFPKPKEIGLIATIRFQHLDLNCGLG